MRMDYARIQLYLDIKGGTSLKNLIHMGQLYNSTKFQKYDYGNRQNLLKYGQEHPPEIDISKIHVPTALIVAGEDQIGDARDNAEVLSLLPNVVFHKVYDNEDHLSLQFSKNMTYFDEIMPLIDRYMLQELTGIAAID